MAYRRKRIALDQIEGFLKRLKALPIESLPQTPSEVLELPALAQAHGLTNYDATYLAIAISSHSPLATNDNALRRAATAAGVTIVTV